MSGAPVADSSLSDSNTIRLMRSSDCCPILVSGPASLHGCQLCNGSAEGIKTMIFGISVRQRCHARRARIWAAVASSSAATRAASTYDTGWRKDLRQCQATTRANDGGTAARCGIVRRWLRRYRSRGFAAHRRIQYRSSGSLTNDRRSRDLAGLSTNFLRETRSTCRRTCALISAAWKPALCRSASRAGDGPLCSSGSRGACAGIPGGCKAAPQRGLGSSGMADRRPNTGSRC